MYQTNFSKIFQPNVDTHISMAEILGAFSYALDLTQGQPKGHCIRVCWIGSHIGQAIGLNETQLWELYYTLLLKDLGCSSNAARICELYLADDHAIKHDYKLIDGRKANVLKFVLGRTASGAPLKQRIGALANIVKNGADIERSMIATRCSRGADIARRLRFSDSVADGIAGLDEHWDGSGLPAKLKGNEIPLYSRIALLAQVIDVFQMANGAEAACEEVESRAGGWFDPALCDAFLNNVNSDDFWIELNADDLDAKIFMLEPAQNIITVDEDYLDDIADAFGRVIDAKSPYTSGHSGRVGTYVEQICMHLGYDRANTRKLRRAAVLHDIGKLGVSNLILDKPAKLDNEEWKVMQSHAKHTADILSHITIFKDMAMIASAHHERLDGKGYPHGVNAEDICMDTRIITTCDFFDALTADRPYRAAMSVTKALDIMRAEIGSAVDAECFAALEAIVSDNKIETAQSEAV